jgi:hypothetical protein
VEPVTADVCDNPVLFVQTWRWLTDASANDIEVTQPADFAAVVVGGVAGVTTWEAPTG